MIKHKFLPYVTALLLLASLTLGAAQSDTERLHKIVDTKVHAITDILNDVSIDKPQKNVKIMDIAEEMIAIGLAKPYYGGKKPQW